MINLRFVVDNPWWGDRFDTLWWAAGSTPFKTKFWEAQLMKDTTLLGLCARLSTRCDHAGLELEFSLFGYSFNFNFYDNRHWNYAEGRYYVYNEEQGMH